MRGLNIARIAGVSFLLMLTVLSLSGCSVLGKEISFQPDAGTNEWLKRDPTTIFKFDDSSIEAYPMRGSNNTISFGPPLLPFIPSFGATPHWDVQFLRLKVRASADVLKMDLSAVKLHFPSGISILSEKLGELGEAGRVDLNKDRMITLEKGEKEISVSFNAPFDQSESFVVEFGNVLIGTSQIPLPQLRYIRETKYRYFPFMFSH